jgi:hypothetical protein
MALATNVVDESAMTAVSPTPSSARSCPRDTSFTGRARTIRTTNTPVKASKMTWPGMRPSPPGRDRRRSRNQLANHRTSVANATIASSGRKSGSAASRSSKMPIATQPNPNWRGLLARSTAGSRIPIPTLNPKLVGVADDFPAFLYR